jgi:hypothetical protein
MMKRIKHLSLNRTGAEPWEVQARAARCESRAYSALGSWEAFADNVLEGIVLEDIGSRSAEFWLRLLGQVFL